MHVAARRTSRRSRRAEHLRGAHLVTDSERAADRGEVGEQVADAVIAVDHHGAPTARARGVDERVPPIGAFDLPDHPVDRGEDRRTARHGNVRRRVVMVRTAVTDPQLGEREHVQHGGRHAPRGDDERARISDQGAVGDGHAGIGRRRRQVLGSRTMPRNGGDQAGDRHGCAGSERGSTARHGGRR